MPAPGPQNGASAEIPDHVVLVAFARPPQRDQEDDLDARSGPLHLEVCMHNAMAEQWAEKERANDRLKAEYNR